MTKTVDATTMRQINKKYVTEIIYNHGPLSRIDISQITGLNRATVSSLVDELISEELVNEIGFGTSKGGRKPILLQFNASAGYCIGIDIQITHMITVLSDMSGGIIFRSVRPLDCEVVGLTKLKLEEFIIEEINLAIINTPSSRHNIIGVGIALPGIVNFETGSVFYLPNIEIHNWDICDTLSKHFPFPVFIDNDGNCGVLSEYRLRQINNLVFVNVGIGIGTGIIMNGQLYRGTHGIAGEFGHMTISAMGLLCACGNYGCWEQYASERALLRYLCEEEEEISKSLKLSPNFVSLAVERAIERQSYKRAFQVLGKYLGIGISNIVNGLNTELIVIGGTISLGADYFLPELQSALRHRSLASNKHTPIAIAHRDTIVRGAVQLTISNTILRNPLS